ncbi:hypothetical protein [Caproiciproducens sp.]|uniref:hypothetical protein n=1 Tax=Caproiciproducens sp. TaxID=1954376 RepID=UPI00289A2594|nr:hypothetical protein [Caproiciproducens sp.]
MDSMIVFIFLYAVLICTDLIPLIKEKDKKVLFFSVPVYLLTLTVNIMQSFGFNLSNPNNVIKQIITSIFHIS